MRAVWFTDIHFEHLEPKQINQFLAEIAAEQPDATLVCGDIAWADQIRDRLELMAEIIAQPIYFVLGNHDYYGGSISDVRSGMKKLSEESDHINWLPPSGVIELTESTALVGHGCWADGRAGDFYKRPELLTDYFVIDELKGLEDDVRLSVIQGLGDEAANYLNKVLLQAFQNHSHVIVLTHAPPFEQACLYRGQAASDDILPHFVCKAAGDLLRELLAQNRERKVTVLSGHTHDRSEVSILPNLKVMTGKARYGQPEIQRVFELE